jgi:hypothetical protein
MIVPSIYGPVGVVVDQTSETLYLSSYFGDSISIFENINDTATAGNIPPVHRIFGKNTGLSGPVGTAFVKAVGTDSDQLYLANLLENNILEFELAQCSGIVECDITPASISSYNDPNTNTDLTDNLLSPIGIIVDTRQADDREDDLFYVSYRDRSFNDNQGNSVVMFGRSSSGGLTPLRRIRSLNIPLVGPRGMYLDPIRQELYVANLAADQILVFNVDEEEFLKPNTCNTATPQVCDLAPIRVITQHEPSSNPFDPVVTRLYRPTGVFLDNLSSPPKLYVSGRGVDPQSSTDNPTTEDGILVYNSAETVNGAVVPDRVIGSIFGIFDPSGIFLDPAR